MRFLMFAPFFAPVNNSQTQKNISIANGLVRNGHEVEVITLQIPKDYAFSDYSLVDFVESSIEIVPYIPDKLYRYFYPRRKSNENSPSEISNSLRYTRRMLANLAKRLVFPDFYRARKLELNRSKLSSFDYVISLSNPKSAHISLLSYWKKYKFKWIQVWGDPWYYDVAATERVSSRKIFSLEEELLDSATKILYFSERTLQQQKLTFPNSAKKMEYLPMSFIEEVRTTDRHDSKIVLAYFGTLYGFRNPENLLEALRMIRKEGYNVEMNFFGSIRDRHIQDLFKSKRYSNFVRHGGILNYAEVIREICASDILVVIFNQVGNQIPGKLYEFLGTDRDILCIMNEDFSFDGKEFCFCTLDSTAIIHETLKRIINRERPLPEKGPIDRYSPESIARRLESLIYKV